jgi:type I restriction enzyme S subunit
LREQLSAVAEARAAVQAQFDAARTLPAAHLRAVFNSAAASRWPKRRIGEVAKIQSGYAFKSEWFACDGIRLLRNANVSQDRIYWTDTARLPAARRAEFPTYELSEGDIILSLDRPVVSGGLKVARVSSGDLPALLLQRVGRFQLRDGIQANYLYHFLHTQEFIDEITAHDQSLGVPHVSPKQVEHVQLPVPPVAEQCTVAARIEAELGDARALATHLSARLAALNHLPAALLREAFRGRL